MSSTLSASNRYIICYNWTGGSGDIDEKSSIGRCDNGLKLIIMVHRLLSGGNDALLLQLIAARAETKNCVIQKFLSKRFHVYSDERDKNFRREF